VKNIELYLELTPWME